MCVHAKIFEASDMWHLVPKDAKLWKVESGGIFQEDNSKEGGKPVTWEDNECR
jgi:hypothetical protein